LIFEVCVEDNVKVSLPKTHIMTVYTGTAVDKDHVSASLCGGEVTESDKAQCYLGIWLDAFSMEKFCTHREKLLTKMEFAGWQIMKFLSENQDLSFANRKILLRNKLRSVVSHGVELVIPFAGELFTKKELSIWRRVLGCQRRPAAEALLWLLGMNSFETEMRARLRRRGVIWSSKLQCLKLRRRETKTWVAGLHR
jgi:hypothetical protein